jgi:hypothetical protein
MHVMNNKIGSLAHLGLGTFLVASAAGSFGCVASRDSRNGVFNENQYVRKDFLIRPDTSGNDSGWMIRASVNKVSSPNPLGGFGITTGVVTPGDYVRFDVTQDKLEMLSQMELSGDSLQRTPAILESWPITNVDLKYRINLDGETTNFYEENQELPWADRQWVKWNPSHNDLSDLNLYGITNDYLGLCVDMAGAAVTLVPDSYVVDTDHDYMSWSTRVTLPLKTSDQACGTFFGTAGSQAQGSPEGGPAIHHPNVVVELMYSMVRATPTSQITYQPLEIAEKDPIRHKYGTIDEFTLSRDADTGLMTSRQLAQRHDPKQAQVVYYFSQDFPGTDSYKALIAANPSMQQSEFDYKSIFLAPGTGIKDVTNKLLEDAGVTMRLDFREWNAADDQGNTLERKWGDIRYNWIGWGPDYDNGAGYSGVTSFTSDPRTGQILSTMINVQEHDYKDVFVQVLDAYLRSIGASDDVNSGAEWPHAGEACTIGDVESITPSVAQSDHNNDSVYQKMQLYMQRTSENPLGPSDYVPQQDGDFFRAFYALMPYQIFADPAMNPFVVPEGGNGVYGPAAVYPMMQKEAEFQQTLAAMDKGDETYSPYDFMSNTGLTNAVSFLNRMRDLTHNHREMEFAKMAMVPRNVYMEPVDVLSIETAFQTIARHCAPNDGGLESAPAHWGEAGHWESKAEWIHNLIYGWERSVLWHEFGHSLGLDHNFMGSVDRQNFPVLTDKSGQPLKDKSGKVVYGLYSNSIMEYGNGPADTYFGSNTWAPYDIGALHFIYSNDKAQPAACDPTTVNITGQCSPSNPWHDEKGWSADGKTEDVYLFCNASHLKYTPFCRQHDFGSTPSEIMAADINSYELHYAWSNYRLYRKIWDNSLYANRPAAFMNDMKRFILSWEYDWSAGELADTFRRIGIKNPDPNGSQLEYYTQLTNKFNKDASMAAQMMAAFHKAIIQQSSGERPYRTVYDKFYGDVTQQGIILDKFFAMQSFVGLWPGDMYDPNQSGVWFASYSGIGDSSYEYVAEDAVSSMIGGQYDVYPYFVPLAVAQFAQDTHSPSFFGRIEVRDWIGGHTFYREQDFLDYFRQIAIDNNFAGASGCTAGSALSSCTYDPRAISDDHNEFFGPDKRQWIWAYVMDRNQWVAVQKERNIASYIIVRNYTDDVVYQLDDGAFPGGAYGALLPMKYFLDSFNTFN